MQRPVSLAAPLAALTWAAAIIGFGALFPVFSHLEHPVGLLGATQVPRAAAFNTLAFVVPGLLAMVAGAGLRGRLAGAPWSARIGAQTLLLSGLAFALQGLLPLDSVDLDAARSRLHAAAWTLWWIAFAVGAALLGWGLRRQSLYRTGALVAACAAAALGLALLAPVALPPGLCQRLAFALWFVALWLAARPQP